MKDRREIVGARRVVIVGGGFGGLEAAKALGHTPCEVTLVDRINYHLFQPLLYQVAMAGLSPADIASPIRGILADEENVRVVLGEVTGVDFEKKCVDVENLGSLPYDWLILAIGAKTSYFGHDEWEKHAPSLKTIEDALEIRHRVLLAFERAELEEDPRMRQKLLSFVVIGGGPTGVELAGAIAELARHVLSKDFRAIDPREAKVTLVEAGERIVPSFPVGLGESAVRQLGDLRVDVVTDSRVVTIDEDGVDIQASASEKTAQETTRRLLASTVLWAAGVRAGSLAESLGVPLDRQGRVVVGADCSVANHSDVFAIGDMARFEEDGKVLPGVSPVAMQQARYVAKLIAREIKADGGPSPRRPFSYFDKGSMSTIGRSRAIAWARGLELSGFVAWLAWLFVHIWYLIGFRNRLSVLLSWTWSYFAYKRGARLITDAGWHPAAAARHPLPPRPKAASVPSLLEGERSRESASPRERAPTPRA